MYFLMAERELPGIIGEFKLYIATTILSNAVLQPFLGGVAATADGHTAVLCMF